LRAVGSRTFFPFGAGAAVVDGVDDEVELKDGIEPEVIVPVAGMVEITGMVEVEVEQAELEESQTTAQVEALEVGGQMAVDG